jgi:hypothetical protein
MYFTFGPLRKIFTNPCCRLWIQLQSHLFYVQFDEVLTAVVVKGFIFWEITPCGRVRDNRHFGGACHFHLQGWRISQARNRRDTGCKLSYAGFLLGLFFNLMMEAMFSSKMLVDFQQTTQCYIPEDKILISVLFSLNQTFAHFFRMKQSVFGLLSFSSASKWKTERKPIPNEGRDSYKQQQKQLLGTPPSDVYCRVVSTMLHLSNNCWFMLIECRHEVPFYLCWYKHELKFIVKSKWTHKYTLRGLR